MADRKLIPKSARPRVGQREPPNNLKDLGGKKGYFFRERSEKKEMGGEMVKFRRKIDKTSLFIFVIPSQIEKAKMDGGGRTNFSLTFRKRRRKEEDSIGRDPGKRREIKKNH